MDQPNYGVNEAKTFQRMSLEDIKSTHSEQKQSEPPKLEFLIQLALASKTELQANGVPLNISLPDLVRVKNFLLENNIPEKIDTGHLVRYSVNDLWTNQLVPTMHPSELDSFFDSLTRKTLIEVHDSHVAIADLFQLKNVPKPFFTAERIRRLEKEGTKVHPSHKLVLTSKEFPDISAKLVAQFYDQLLQNIDPSHLIQYSPYDLGKHNAELSYLDFERQAVEQYINDGFPVHVFYKLLLPRNKKIGDVSKEEIFEWSKRDGKIVHDSHLSQFPASELRKNGLSFLSPKELQKLIEEKNEVHPSHFTRLSRDTLTEHDLLSRIDPSIDLTIEVYADALKSNSSDTEADTEVPFIHISHVNFLKDDTHKRLIRQNNKKIKKVSRSRDFYSGRKSSESINILTPPKKYSSLLCEKNGMCRMRPSDEKWPESTKFFVLFRNDAASINRLLTFVHNLDSLHEKNVYLREKENRVFLPIPSVSEIENMHDHERLTDVFEAVTHEKFKKGMSLQPWSVLQDHIDRLNYQSTGHPHEVRSWFRPSSSTVERRGKRKRSTFKLVLNNIPSKTFDIKRGYDTAPHIKPETK